MLVNEVPDCFGFIAKNSKLLGFTFWFNSVVPCNTLNQGAVLVKKGFERKSQSAEKSKMASSHTLRVCRQRFPALSRHRTDDCLLGKRAWLLVSNLWGLKTVTRRKRVKSALNLQLEKIVRTPPLPQKYYFGYNVKAPKSIETNICWYISTKPTF